MAGSCSMKHQIRPIESVSPAGQPASSSTHHHKAPRPSIACPVCGEQAQFAYPHPEANIYRCRNCTHAFSDPKSLRETESYSPEYYEETHQNWFANPNFALFAWIDRQIPADARSLIDIGCGRGQFLDYLRANRPNIRLVGVDLSENAPRNNIEFYRGDVSDFQLGSFDVVVTMATIEHVDDVASFAQSIHDVCGPRGIAFVMTLDDGSLLYRASRMAWRLGVSVGFDRLYSAHHLNHFTHRSLVTLLERAGFRAVRSLHCSVPLKALDLPVSPLLRPIFKAGVKTIFSAGDLFGLSYLQTIMVEKSSDLDR